MLSSQNPGVSRQNCRVLESPGIEYHVCKGFCTKNQCSASLNAWLLFVIAVQRVHIVFGMDKLLGERAGPSSMLESLKDPQNIVSNKVCNVRSRLVHRRFQDAWALTPLSALIYKMKQLLKCSYWPGVQKPTDSIKKTFYGKLAG
jgi:hypothetical protein